MVKCEEHAIVQLACRFPVARSTGEQHGLCFCCWRSFVIQAHRARLFHYSWCRGKSDFIIPHPTHRSSSTTKEHLLLETEKQRNPDGIWASMARLYRRISTTGARTMMTTFCIPLKEDPSLDLYWIPSRKSTTTPYGN